MKKTTNTINHESILLSTIACTEIKVDDFSSLSKNEQTIIESLLNRGLITKKWQKKAIYDDYEIYTLTRQGEIHLFKETNSIQITRFIEMLKSMRYDDNILDDFLMRQDLDQDIWHILDINNYEKYCNDFDRALTIPGTETVFFNRLVIEPQTILDKEGTKAMEDLLAVYDNHCIHICHPNHIFGGAKLITRDISKIYNVNWNDLDASKMFRIGDYKTFISPNCKPAFRYIHEKLGHQVMDKIKRGVEDTTSYLAVVEEYPYDFEQNYILRGIIAGDKDGYLIAFNPEYQKTIPQSLFEKSLRFGDNETPEIYLKKRPNQKASE